jgi:hypothetical protein
MHVGSRGADQQGLRDEQNGELSLRHRTKLDFIQKRSRQFRFAWNVCAQRTVMKESLNQMIQVGAPAGRPSETHTRLRANCDPWLAGSLLSS